MRKAPYRRLVIATAIVSTLMLALVPAAAGQSEPPTPAEEGPAGPTLLTDPYLQLPTEDSVNVAWVTEWPGALHLVFYGDLVGGLSEEQVERALRAAQDGPEATRREQVVAAVPGAAAAPGIRVVFAETDKLSRTREDQNSDVPDRTYTEVTDRDLWRHEAVVGGLEQGERVPYRVASLDPGGGLALSEVFTLAPLPEPGTPQKILLTSDHQLMPLTPANLQMVSETVGQVDAVFLAGDLVNIPDRASEWFDDADGGAFFPALQGNADAEVTRGDTTSTWQGGEIIQHAPLYPAIGNHEVMGRVDAGDLGAQFNSPLPVHVAEDAYEEVADIVNPGDDPAIREAWITDHSFNADTYEELFTLPTSDTGGEGYYATTFGDVRLISLYATRIWRTPRWDVDQAGAFREALGTLDDEYLQGWGRHIFEPIAEGSEQYDWLEAELDSPAFQAATHRIVILHHPLHTLGDNVNPPFTDPHRFEERDSDDNLSFIRYDYPKHEDYLLRDVAPLLQDAGVDLVLNGHSHVWNRFTDADGVDYLETSNVGNTYGAYTEDSGRTRVVPPPPWNSSFYTVVGDPGGLEPIVPTENPLTGPDGRPLPYVSSNDVTVFSILDTGDGMVTSYATDLREPDAQAFVLDAFSIGPEGASLAPAD